MFERVSNSVLASEQPLFRGKWENIKGAARGLYRSPTRTHRRLFRSSYFPFPRTESLFTALALFLPMNYSIWTEKGAVYMLVCEFNKESDVFQ